MREDTKGEKNSGSKSRRSSIPAHSPTDARNRCHDDRFSLKAKPSEGHDFQWLSGATFILINCTDIRASASETNPYGERPLASSHRVRRVRMGGGSDQSDGPCRRLAGLAPPPPPP